jgi:hypothetical protein
MWSRTCTQFSYSTKESKMKLKNVIASVVTTLALAGVVAQTQGGLPMMMGGGYYGMGGMGGGAIFSQLNDAYAGLDLTADQQATIAGIQKQVSSVLWPRLG